MRRAGERGLVLVPVALALAVTGALAWAMVREGALDVATVRLEYEAQVARYLAEAGVNLVRWQNEQTSCNNTLAFGTLGLPGGTVRTNSVQKVSGGLSIDVSASTPGGGAARLVRAAMPVYDSHQRKTANLHGKTSVDDTWLVQGSSTALGTSKNFFQLTDDAERGVVQFILTTIGDALIVNAQFQLAQEAPSKTLPPTMLVYVHRVTTPWSEVNAHWYFPWLNPGGDFIDAPAAVMPVAKQNAYYSTRIDALADAWVRQTVPNYGVLLTSLGLDQAKFGQSEDDGHSPKLAAIYYPRCK
jgi:hypothetical protein